MYKDIKREIYLSRIRPFYDTDYIKAITGIRRAGKSVILRQIIEELLARGTDEDHILYYDLEGESGEGITTRKKLEQRLHKDIKDDGFYYIFIDEVQRIRQFEEAIASVRVSYGCSLFVTGSNSRLLHGKLQDRLTGRAKEFVIYPFSYKEACEFKEINGIPIGRHDFEDYLKWGGLPQRYMEPDEAGIHKYHTDLVHSIMEKDIFSNHKRLFRTAFENVASYILETSGREFSASSVAGFLYGNARKEELLASSRTISNYAEYLEESFLTVKCKPYYIAGKRALKGVRKYYCVSSGIRTSFTNTIDTDPSFALEGLVFLELLSRGYEVYTGILRNGEIDFVVVNGGKRCLLQVAYYLTGPETTAREFGAFDKIKARLPEYVLSLDSIDQSREGIRNINIVDWLLGEVELRFE